MRGKMWETKSPIRYSDSTFEYNFKKAMRQSSNIIFDLRRLSEKDEKKYLKELVKRANSRKVTNLIVINRQGAKLDIKGRI